MDEATQKTLDQYQALERRLGSAIEDLNRSFEQKLIHLAEKRLRKIMENTHDKRI